MWIVSAYYQQFDIVLASEIWTHNEIQAWFVENGQHAETAEDSRYSDVDVHHVVNVVEWKSDAANDNS
jgi:hypothetical protein